MKRLASGPLGPASTFATRRGQKVGSARAVIAACLAVLDDDGDPCPSIENVIGAGRGFSRSTLNRKRYKPILHAAKARHAARAAGTWREGDDDALSRMEELVATGVWTMPTDPEAVIGDVAGDDAADVTDDGAAAASALDGDDDVPPEAPVDPETLAAANAALLAELEALRAKIAKRDEDIQERDDQLYHAIQTTQAWGRTITSLRARIAELMAEIETLQAAPWEPRELGGWAGDEDE